VVLLVSKNTPVHFGSFFVTRFGLKFVKESKRILKSLIAITAPEGVLTIRVMIIQKAQTLLKNS